MGNSRPYIYQILLLLKKLAVLLLIYTVCRILFYLFNASYFNNATPFQLFKIFFFGIRFDYTAIILYNLPFIVLYLLPFKFVWNKNYRSVVFVLFWVVNGALIFTNFGDIEYFKYTSKRTTADIFKYMFISDDVVSLIPQFLRDFWYIPLFWFITVFLGIWVTRENIKVKSGILKFRVINFLIMLVFTGILFITARGFGMKPIRIISAARYADSQDIPLLINTPFSILHTIQNNKAYNRKYFPDHEYQKVFSPVRKYKAFQKRNDNVVILIMESFSHEFIGTLSGKKTYTPFLDSLMSQSLYFENGFANCRKSIEAIPAILAGFPSLANDSYISSRYAGNRLEALPYILEENGYSTAFFHGGKNGTMGFDEFAKAAGIKYYFGLKEYEGPKAFDGNWGVYDYEFLAYSAQEMSRLKTPFFSAIFTLSSHHPYTIPAEFENLIPKNEVTQLRAIRYSDMALRNFFNEARKQPWFNNTLFVIVADHTAKIIDKSYNNPVGTYRIPVVFYHPGDTTLVGRRKDIAQQTDIMPSVLQYLGIDRPFVSYGTSVFDKGRKAYSIDYLNGIYYYFEKGYIINFDGDSILSVHNYIQDPALKTELIGKIDSLKYFKKNIQAIIQDYGERLETNKMFFQYNVNHKN
jgi:phosphoglycerol transferase MdoB-like AlkP superfamily enzyme